MVSYYPRIISPLDIKLGSLYYDSLGLQQHNTKGSCDFDIKEPWDHRIMYTMGPWLHRVLVSWANVAIVPGS